MTTAEAHGRSARSVSMSGESFDEPGVMRGRCFCGAPLVVERSVRMLTMTLVHDEMPIACTSPFLLRHQQWPGFDQGMQFVHDACISHDEWANIWI